MAGGHFFVLFLSKNEVSSPYTGELVLELGTIKVGSFD